MNKLEKYQIIQKIFESHRDLIENITDPEQLTNFLENYRFNGLRYYKEKNFDAFQYYNRLYQISLDRMKKLNINTKNYPATLEAIMN